MGRWAASLGAWTCSPPSDGRGRLLFPTVCWAPSYSYWPLTEESAQQSCACNRGAVSCRLPMSCSFPRFHPVQSGAHGSQTASIMGALAIECSMTGRSPLHRDAKAPHGPVQTRAQSTAVLGPRLPWYVGVGLCFTQQGRKIERERERGNERWREHRTVPHRTAPHTEQEACWRPGCRICVLGRTVW